MRIVVFRIFIYEGIRKKYALFWLKKYRFLYWGAHSQNQLHLISMQLRFIWTQSDLAANKRAFKHCTPSMMVSLASSTPVVSILIPKWVQKTTKERQKLHIPKYHYFWRYFCIFSEFLTVLTCSDCVEKNRR